MDTCDSIVSVSGISDAFSVELVKFKKLNGAILFKNIVSFISLALLFSIVYKHKA